MSSFSWSIGIEFPHYFIDTIKTYKFNPINSKAGNETYRLSFDLIRTSTPKNINKASPPEESIKIGL